MQKKLDRTEHVAITTDLWTSLQTKSYCGVTTHYISETWELTSTVLETFEFPAAHTGENTASQRADEGHDSLEHITDKIVCSVTDNASNMISAISKTGWRYLPCFAHSLSLVVQDSIEKDTAVCMCFTAAMQRYCFTLP